MRKKTRRCIALLLLGTIALSACASSEKPTETGDTEIETEAETWAKPDEHPQTDEDPQIQELLEEAADKKEMSGYLSDMGEASLCDFESISVKISPKRITDDDLANRRITFLYDREIQQDALQQIIDSSYLEPSEKLWDFAYWYVLSKEIEKAKETYGSVADMLYMNALSVKEFRSKIYEYTSNYASKRLAVAQIADDMLGTENWYYNIYSESSRKGLQFVSEIVKLMNPVSDDQLLDKAKSIQKYAENSSAAELCSSEPFGNAAMTDDVLRYIESQVQIEEDPSYVTPEPGSLDRYGHEAETRAYEYMQMGDTTDAVSDEHLFSKDDDDYWIDASLSSPFSYLYYRSAANPDGKYGEYSETQKEKLLKKRRIEELRQQYRK